MKTVRLLFGRQVQNGQPNPVLVTIATRGYNIQSRVLHIPDSLGIFTRGGSPRRSAYEGYVFVYASLYLLLVALMFSCCIMVLEDLGIHSPWIPISFVIMYITVVIFIWGIVLYSPRRMPFYNWGDSPEVLRV